MSHGRIEEEVEMVVQSFVYFTEDNAWDGDGIVQIRSGSAQWLCEQIEPRGIYLQARSTLIIRDLAPDKQWSPITAPLH